MLWHQLISIFIFVPHGMVVVVDIKQNKDGRRVGKGLAEVTMGLPQVWMPQCHLLVRYAYNCHSMGSIRSYINQHQC